MKLLPLLLALAACSSSPPLNRSVLVTMPACASTCAVNVTVTQNDLRAAKVGAENE